MRGDVSAPADVHERNQWMNPPVMSVGLTDDSPNKTHVQRKFRYQRLYLHTQDSVNSRSASASKTVYLRVMAL